MTDTTVNDKKQVPLFVRIVGGIMASGITSFLLTMCSLSGTNFEVLGINPEFIKATITGSLTGILVAPECIPIAIAAGILSFRMGWRMIRNAFTKDLPPETKE